MFSYSRKISHRLVLLTFILSLYHASARYVKPVTYGYELGSPFMDLLPVVSDQDLDLTISAAEPRPVFVELVKRPLSLPLVADIGAISARSEIPVHSASEKIEKILRRPMAFSYNTDLTNAASSLIVNSPREKLESVESRHRLDQQPDAIDYYKYIARLQEEEKEGGAAVQNENNKPQEEKSNQKHEVAPEEEKKSKADLRLKSRPNIFLSYSPSNFHHEYAHGHDHQPTVEFQSTHKQSPQKQSEEIHEEAQKSKSEDHKGHDEHHHHHYEAKPVNIGIEAGDKAEATESHEEHKKESHHTDQGGHSESHESSSDGGHKQENAKEEVQASASHHGGGGGGGGGGNYKKGGGKEHHSEQQGEHGEHGEKKYSGHHHHEKGEKGHKDKDGHNNEYTEESGKKHGHHEEDGYEGEQHHGEEGKRGSEFHEEGEHSKGHSTQGEHNVHKKDAFEKKQEFYDESHEGGEHEKHGEYFHEDDYHKGGHEKSDHESGGEHEEHYGKQKKHAGGGHEHEDYGHKEAAGRDVHHDHEEKEGEDSKHQGGKKWHYKHGDGNGGDDNKGAHQHIEVVVKDGKAEASGDGKAEASDHSKAEASDHGKAEASDHGKVEDSKGADYHVHEITEKKPQDGGQDSHQGQATEEHGGKNEHHGEHSHHAYNHDSYGGLHGIHGVGSSYENGKASNHHSSNEGDDGHSAKLKSEGNNPEEEKYYNYGDTSYRLHGAENRPRKSEQPNKDKYRSAGFSHNHAPAEEIQNQQNTENGYHHAEALHSDGSHVHPSGHICPGRSHAHAATTHAQKVAETTHNSENESQGQGEESSPNSHILVLGEDGNIYGVLANSDSIYNKEV